MNTLAFFFFSIFLSSSLTFPPPPLIFWLTSQFWVLEECDAWARAGSNCATGVLAAPRRTLQSGNLCCTIHWGISAVWPRVYRNGDFCYLNWNNTGRGKKVARNHNIVSQRACPGSAEPPEHEEMPSVFGWPGELFPLHPAALPNFNSLFFIFFALCFEV